MTKALRLTISGPDLNQTQTFRTFPVRIGRNPAFECCLGFWFVSRSHARVDLQDDDLVLFDEGSRHGIFVRGDERVTDAVPLRDVQGVFRIGELTFQAMLIDDAPAPSGAAPDVMHTLEAPVDGTPEATRVAMAAERPTKADTGEPPAPTRSYSAAAVNPAAMVAEAMAREGAEAPVRAATRTYSRASVDPQQIDADAAREGVRNEPASTLPPKPADTAPPNERASEAIVGGAGISPETARAAHTILQALVDQYAPGFGALDTPQRARIFGDRLDAALRCMFEGGANMLFVYDFEAKGTGSRLRPAELAAMVLGTKEGVGLLHGAFRQMIGHHARFARQAVKGLRGLLDELAPSAFYGSGFGPFRASARWKAYSRRHAELSAPDERSLLRLFGAAFVRAYSGHAAGGTDDETEDEEPGVTWLTLALGLRPG